MRVSAKILTIIGMSAMLASCSNQSQTPDCQSLTVKDKYLTNANGDTVVLRGVSYGWSNWWPQYYNAESVEWLKKGLKAYGCP